MEATVSRRRSLFAAASAVVLGGGIAAGAVASVADYAEAPDAELIRLCSEFVRLDGLWRAIYDGPESIRDDDEAEAASSDIGRQMNLVLDRMDSLHATTAAGVVARAHALAAENGDFASSFDYQDTIPGRLLTCLLRDAAAVATRTAS